jgi:N-acetylglucosamine kinase-like BadF-type ATPase
VGVIGVDGGNTKTELLVVDDDGEPLAYVRGPGSNSHGLGTDGCVRVIARLVERARPSEPAEHGAFFLCGADVPADLEALVAELGRRRWTRELLVDNDTFALLHAGSDAPDAVAVVCGAGINCVGRAADGRVARYPSLGWETGDWGGSEMLGREALFLAARAEDSRGEPTVLVPAIVDWSGSESVAALGEAVHYGRVPQTRLGELAPVVLAAARDGDGTARGLVERLADEIVLLVLRALRGLGLDGRPVDVVLGGGMLSGRDEPLHGAVLERLAEQAPHARPSVLREPPVLGAALAALDAAGAPARARERLREAMRDGLAPEQVS